LKGPKTPLKSPYSERLNFFYKAGAPKDYFFLRIAKRINFFEKLLKNTPPISPSNLRITGGIKILEVFSESTPPEHYVFLRIVRNTFFEKVLQNTRTKPYVNVRIARNSFFRKVLKNWTSFPRW